MTDKKFLPSLVAFLATTSGRDKSCRIVQYYSRFLSAHYKSQAESNPANKSEIVEKAGKCDRLGGAMGMTRKVLRFGRPIGIMNGILEDINSILSGKVKNVPKGILKILGSLSLLLFFLFDHYLWFQKIGVVNNPVTTAWCDYLSNLFWLFECIFGILKNILEYLDLQKQNSSSYEKRTKTQELIIDTARNVVDVPIAYGFMNSQFIGNSKMGILGTITSVIGAYQVWK